MHSIQSNANVKSVDHDGRTCISYARSASSGSPSQDIVDLLLNNGCPDVTLTGTLPRSSRKANSVQAAASGGGRKHDVMEKIASSVL